MTFLFRTNVLFWTVAMRSACDMGIS